MDNYHDRRVRKSKIALKNALISLLQQKNLQQITVTKIVQAADVNRGTFYKHYQYKEELLEEMVDDVILDLIDSYREPLKEGEKISIDNLNVSAIKIFDHVEKHADFYTIIAKSNALVGLQSRICMQLTDLMKEVVEQTREIKGIELNLLASYQAYAIWGLIREWIDQDFKYSATYMSNQLLTILHFTRYS
ncbi:TetR/AcrR family transcriptional regulator [Gracilibacillus suaedae]|uniref:TetR/AcrR family transcriptional regulator n=1 Tax=Gracilibacillus suaedae TaxID=2820273 RepID=UPI001ABEBCAE|nr:TetR/AcrR family transcriptional regulator [Gracilibacillus suaedae]